MKQKKNLFLIYILIFVMILSPLLTGSHIFADPEDGASSDAFSTTTDASPTNAPRMDFGVERSARFIAGNATACDADPAMPIPNDAPEITSLSGIVMDVDTGEILYEKDAFSAYYPASTTKLLTGMIAIDKLNLSDTVTVAQSDIDAVPETYVNIYLTKGEKMSVEDMLYALLVYSSNDVAFSLGRTVSGDIESFAKLMNETATELGCVNSNFRNPSGISDPSHYSCAYDLALIGCKAYHNSDFRKISSAFSHTIPGTNLDKNEREFFNTNRLISKESNYYYEYATAGKTGYTEESNGCLVAFAEKDGRRLCCTVMNCDPDTSKFSDAATLFDYCFENYTTFKPLENYDLNSVDMSNDSCIIRNFNRVSDVTFFDYAIDRNFKLSIRTYVNPEEITGKPFFTAPDKNGVAGYIEFYYQGVKIGKANIYIDNGMSVYGNATSTDAGLATATNAGKNTPVHFPKPEGSGADNSAAKDTAAIKGTNSITGHKLFVVFLLAAGCLIVLIVIMALIGKNKREQAARRKARGRIDHYEDGIDQKSKKSGGFVDRFSYFYYNDEECFDPFDKEFDDANKKRRKRN